MGQFALLINSLVGVLLLALLAKLYWPSSWRLDEERVKRAFSRSDYNLKIKEIWVDSKQSAALAKLDTSQSIGYAFTFGDRITCRHIKAEDIRSISTSPNHIDIKFSDYTLKPLSFDFSQSRHFDMALLILANLYPKIGEEND